MTFYPAGFPDNHGKKIKKIPGKKQNTSANDDSTLSQHHGGLDSMSKFNEDDTLMITSEWEEDERATGACTGGGYSSYRKMMVEKHK
eukprot:2956982-Ditylum_brightwellii.AAC.1